MAKKTLIIILVSILALAIILTGYLGVTKQLTAMPPGMETEEKRYPFAYDWDISDDPLVKGNPLNGDIILSEGVDLDWVYAIQLVGKGCGADINLKVNDGSKIYQGGKGLASCSSLFYADPGSESSSEYQHYQDFDITFTFKGLDNNKLPYNIVIKDYAELKEGSQLLYPFKLYVWEMVECRVNTQCGRILMPGTNIRVQTICDQVYHACRIPATKQEQIIIQQPITEQPPDIIPSVPEIPEPPKEFNVWWIIGGVIVIVGIILYFILRKK